MKKTVAIVSCAWPPNGGGMGNNAYYTAKNMRKHGFLVHAFTPDYPCRAQSPSDVTPEFLPVTFPIGKAGFLFGLEKHIRDIDIIHLEYPFFGTDLIVWWIKKKYPQKKLVLHYKMDPIGSGIKKWIFRLYVALFLKSLVKMSDLVCVLSFDHAQHSYLAPYLHMYPDKFVEVPNGVDTQIFSSQPKDVQLLTQHHLNIEDDIALFVGGLDVQHYFKGVDVLLRAFAQSQLQSKKLIIIGDGDLRQSYQNLAKELGVFDRVLFLGWVDNRDLPRYYALADVLVLPSTDNTECFGIVVAEAMACGKPTIVSNWPGVRSTLVDQETGFLVEPKSVEDLVQKISMVFADKERAKQFGVRGRERAVQYYDWDVVIGRIKQLYERL